MVRKLINEEIIERGIDFDTIKDKERVKDLKELDKEFRRVCKK